MKLGSASRVLGMTLTWNESLAQKFGAVKSSLNYRINSKIDAFLGRIKAGIAKFFSALLRFN